MLAHKDKAPIPIIASSVSLGFIVLCLVVYLLHVGRTIIIPFVVAIFVWYLINAVARWLGRLSIFKFNIPRFFCFTMALMALSCGLWVIFELITSNLSQVMSSATVYQNNFEKIMPKLVERLDLEYTPTIRDFVDYLDFGETIKMLARTFTGFAGKTLIVSFYVGFLLYEQRYFDKKIINMIKDKRTENKVRQALANIDNKMQRYIGIKSLVSLVDSVLTFSILSFFHIDFAAFWGLMAFFLHFIPYAGSFIAISIPSTIAMLQYADPHQGLVVAGALAVSHAFLGHFLDPFLMGDKLNLSPIFIISSLAMWGMVWGIPGMFLAIPILAMILISLSQFPSTRSIAILISKTGNISNEESNETKD